MILSFLRTRIAAALIGVVALGCLGGSPTPRFYTLSEASGPAAGAPLAALPDLGLVAGPIELPRYLDRPEIVTRDGANRLVLADAHRWAGSLRNDLLRIVGDDLGRLLGTPRVEIYPNEPRFPATYRILIEIREFEGGRGAGVVLRARWTIAATSDGHAVFVAESRFEQSAGNETIDAMVAAESAALGMLTHEIAARIAALPRP
jgi:uncharacterized lipoprotein YmbA